MHCLQQLQLTKHFCRHNPHGYRKKKFTGLTPMGDSVLAAKKRIKLKFMEDTKINSYQTKQPFPVHELAEY